MILRDLGKKIHKFDNGLDIGTEVEDDMKDDNRALTPDMGSTAVPFN